MFCRIPYSPSGTAPIAKRPGCVWGYLKVHRPQQQRSRLGLGRMCQVKLWGEPKDCVIDKQISETSTEPQLIKSFEVPNKPGCPRAEGTRCLLHDVATLMTDSSTGFRVFWENKRSKAISPPTPFPGDADSTVIILPLQNATAKIRDPWELPYKATGRLGQITAPFERRAPPIPIKALNR